MPVNTADKLSTLAGGGAGGALLATVRWEQIPYGEALKIPVAFLLFLVCYLMYRGQGEPPATA